MTRDEEKSGQGRFKRNIRAVERYVTLLQPKLERQTGGVINMEEMGKPESTPPLTDKALDLIGHPDNINAANKLEPIFRDMGLAFDNPTLGYMLTLLGVAGLRHGDPGAVRRWRAGETGDDKLLARFFERAIKWVAEELERRHPGIEIRVEMDPDDEEARAKTNKAAGQERTWNKEHSYRLIGPEVQRVKDKEHCTLKAAIARVADMTNDKLGLPCSFPRVQCAYYFWKNEQQEKESA